jgi:four helix bundle protein
MRLINKLERALQELEETGYWLELLRDAQILPLDKLQPMMSKTEELTAILVTIVKSTKNHHPR